MAETYLGIGSNLGDREAYVRRAVGLLSESCKIVQRSSLYEAEPVGFTEQGKFLNSVVCVETAQSPFALLGLLHDIEQSLGRTRKIKNGPRTIDLDILFYGDSVVAIPGLTIPHPRIHERGFVLIPLREIAPNLVHPVFWKRICEIGGETDGISLYRKDRC